MGLNYRSATVDVREPFSVAADALEEALGSLSSMPALQESVLVSTCNRTEVYAVCTDIVAAKEQIDAFYSQLSGLASYSFQDHLYTYEDLEAVSHLHRVISGLDSMVIGETQILGQVRTAFLYAQSVGTTDTVLNYLFRNSIAFAKRAQTETSIGQSAVSVSYAASLLARKVFTSLTDKTALIIGAGKMAELTLTHLRSQGISRVLVVNRTFERARELAKRFAGDAVEFRELSAALAQADIVVSSTGARGYVLTPEIVTPAMKRRKKRPLFCVDIAVPRDIDPALSRMDGVYVYDIDDLQDVVSSGFALRKQEAERVEAMIREEVAAFSVWVSEQDVVPLITELRERANSIQQTVLDSLIHKLPGLDERQIKVIQKHMASVVNQLLRDPIENLKDSVGETGGSALPDAFARIFNLSLQSSHSGSAVEVRVNYGSEGLANEIPLQESEPTVLESIERVSRQPVYAPLCTMT